MQTPAPSVEDITPIIGKIWKITPATLHNNQSKSAPDATKTDITTAFEGQNNTFLHFATVKTHTFFLKNKNIM